MNDKVLLIIPAYNEEECILNTCNKIIDYNKKNKTNYDFVVINDGSKDKTEKILRDNNLNHVELIENLGIGGAVQTGYKYAYLHNYDYAIQVDGDGQHDISYVKNLIEEAKKNKANMVIGSRFINPKLKGFKSSSARRLGIRIISFFIKLFTRKKIYDPTSGFRLVDKNIIKLFASSYPTEYPEPITEVIVIKKKYKISEVAVEMLERQGGKSSIHTWKNAYYMINVIFSMFIESIRRK